MDGQCSQPYYGPCDTWDDRVLYTVLLTIVRLLLSPFPFPSSLPYVPVLSVASSIDSVGLWSIVQIYCTQKYSKGFHCQRKSVL